MPNFIEELYYGKLDPMALCSRKKRRERELLEGLCRVEEQLLNRLKEEEKELFLSFSDLSGECSGEVSLDSFEAGFRLGARFVYDTFVARPDPADRK